VALFNRLADSENRSDVIDELASSLGIEAVFVLIPDSQVGGLRPAIGPSQTLPGGPTWRRFLGLCARPGEHHAEVAYPDRRRMLNAVAHVAADGAVLVLIGGHPALTYAQFTELPFGLLSRLLRAETAEQDAIGAVTAARETAQRTRALAAALDRARTETEAKAAELQRALSEAARLNRALRQLNDTLEERVRERSRELEKQTEERLKAETALLQAQKMEAVGQLTGGVAHDFNNLLSVIIGSLELMENVAGDNPRLLRSIVMAQRAAERGARLNEQLLAFARRQILRPQIIDLNEVIAEYQGLLRRAVGETVTVYMDLTSVPCRCNIDPVHLETAILNLAINARDAMPFGGSLWIETACCAEGEEEIREFCPGSYVRLSVKDNGTGMSADVIDRVFEPFFTTKAEGKGTGLGLSQVHGFVQQSGGYVRIDSNLNEGTNVKFYLPLATGDALEAEPQRPDRVPLRIGSETILVVEDDADVSEIVRSVLSNAGYRILSASNGPEAILMLQADQHIDFLFTDLVMPGGMNGVELARQAQQLRPGLKILLASGYAAGAGVAEEVMRDGLPLMLKPYRHQELLTRIRSMLDSRGP